MKTLVAGVVLVGSLSITAVGCGGSDGGNNNIVGGPACGVAACGGDILGTWRLTEVCADKSVFMDAFVGGLMGACPAANIGAVTFHPSGDLVFNADHSYTSSLSFSGTVVFNLPTSCFQGETCGDIGNDLLARFAADPTVQSFSCTGSGTCACTMQLVPSQSIEAGTYSVSGSTLLTTPTGATAADSQDYCVKGATVTFPASPADTMSSGIVALLGQKS